MKREAVRILICDDDELNLGINKRCVEIISKREEREAEIYSFREPAEEMYFLIESNQIEIAVLDIELGEHSGLEIARKIMLKNPRVPIIFVTAHEEYKGDAFDVLALGYIEKPLNLEKFNLLFTRALCIVESEKRKKFLELLDVVVNKKHMQLRLSSIVSVEKVLRKVELHTIKGKYTVNGTLSEIGERLGSGFIKVSQSVVVNRDKILSVDNTSVYLANGEQHTIGRTYIKQVRNACKNLLPGR